MRNIFDQYESPENRVTHALVSALAEDRRLLRSFVRWVTGQPLPQRAVLRIVEQQLPGESEAAEDEAERRGLPDAWIYDDSEPSWALIIENKVASPIRTGQLDRHRRTAESRGFRYPILLAISPDRPKWAETRACVHKRWTDVYEWLGRQMSRSDWAGHAKSYLEVAEGRMVDQGYLKQGTLTTFTGIPFDESFPYDYREAKRLLGLALDLLRRRRDLRKLGIDAHRPGRPAITGRAGTSVWDFIPLKQSSAAQSFTEFPHLTLSIQQNRVLAITTVPNGIRPALRRNLVEAGLESFRDVLTAVERKLVRALKKAKDAVPCVVMVQRHYPTQRSSPICDALLEFDLRTSLPSGRGSGARKPAVKHQPQWLEATYHALAKKRSNLQLAVGAMFPYSCPILRSRKTLDYFAATWIGCKPLLDALLGRGVRRL